jgi:glycosyltransferase involved in cell wall biosynthesis
LKFTVITPCRNGEALIGDTVRSLARQSVLHNASGHELDYILVDGASTDRTVEFARAEWVEHSNARMRVISEPDAGMYDALAKGVSMASGEVLSYLNAGDYYSDDCLHVLSQAFADHQVKWLTGMRVVYTANGGIFGAKVPWSYSRRQIRHGYHGARGYADAIQQESTFWRSDVMEEVCLDRLRAFRYAGDLYLWVNLASRHELYVVAAHLGGFRYHGDHLSASSAYREESLQIAGKPTSLGTVYGIWHKVAGCLPPSARIRLKLAKRLIAYSIETQTWTSY